MLEAVLFDLDGTLLEIDIEAFIRVYFGRLSETLAAVFDDGDSLELAMRAISEATGATMYPHPGVTNAQVFYEDFARRTGVDLLDHKDLIDAFYRDVFPALGRDLGPMPGAREAFDTAREHGLKVAVATNPIFPRQAILHRLAWAGFDAEEPDIVTDFETMCATKPLPAYFRQTAELLGVSPSACLMVGDDRMLDLAAADVGMRTFHVSEDRDSSADYTGTMRDVASLIRRLCAPEA